MEEVASVAECEAACTIPPPSGKMATDMATKATTMTRKVFMTLKH